VPKSWHFKCLQWQEGVVVTAFICLVVLFENMYVSGLDDTGTFSEQFIWSAGISVLFAFELTLRFYVWWRSYSSMTRTTVGGFLTSSFRLLDVVVVVLDIGIMVLTFVLGDLLPFGRDGQSSKSLVKFARGVRLLRSAKWLRGLRALRSFRLLASVIRRWQHAMKPTPVLVRESIENVVAGLKAAKQDMGREKDNTTTKLKHALEKGTNKILAAVNEVPPKEVAGAGGEGRLLEKEEFLVAELCSRLVESLSGQATQLKGRQSKPQDPSSSQGLRGTKGSVEEVLAFLTACKLENYFGRFRDFGVAEVADFYDDLLTDSDLRAPEVIGMTELDVRRFRKACGERRPNGETEARLAAAKPFDAAQDAASMRGARAAETQEATSDSDRTGTSLNVVHFPDLASKTTPASFQATTGGHGSNGGALNREPGCVQTRHGAAMDRDVPDFANQTIPAYFAATMRDGLQAEHKTPPPSGFVEPLPRTAAGHVSAPSPRPTAMMGGLQAEFVAPPPSDLVTLPWMTAGSQARAPPPQRPPTGLLLPPVEGMRNKRFNENSSTEEHQCRGCGGWHPKNAVARIEKRCMARGGDFLKR